MAAAPTAACGISACGAYVPRLRLQRQAVFDSNKWMSADLRALARGERAVACWDEDAITMGVEAARSCLDGVDRARIARVVFASTTAPFADRQNAVVLKEALNLSDQIATFDIAGGQRAGLAALMDALQIGAAGCGETLCIASEKHRALPGSESEMTQGHAAASFLVGAKDSMAHAVAMHSVSLDFVDHFRHAGRNFDYAWETRWLREEGFGKIAVDAVKAALRKADLAPGAIDAFILPVPRLSMAADVAKAAGIQQQAVRDTLSAKVGDAGCAHSLLMLAHALENSKPGQHILVAAFGSGCDVIILRTTEAVARIREKQPVDAWLRRRAPLAAYTKYLSFSGLLEMEWGMRAELEQKQPLSALYRHRKTVLGLVGTRCKSTGTVQFPPSEIGVAQRDDASGAPEDYPLAERHARILTHVSDYLAFSPNPPARYGTIEFAGGGRMGVEFCDAEDLDLDAGREVRMMFRIKSVDQRRGFERYFWKAAPAG